MESNELGVGDGGVRGGSRAAATSTMERFVIIVNYHKALHLGCCSSLRSTSGSGPKLPTDLLALNFESY